MQIFKRSTLYTEGMQLKVYLIVAGVGACLLAGMAGWLGGVRWLVCCLYVCMVRGC